VPGGEDGNAASASAEQTRSESQPSNHMMDWPPNQASEYDMLISEFHVQDIVPQEKIGDSASQGGNFPSISPPQQSQFSQTPDGSSADLNFGRREKELIGLGQFEALPPFEMIEEL
jgi:hypothetical protein